MTTSASHPTSSASTGPVTPVSGVRGPGTYVISGARQYAVSSLTGDVSLNSEAMPGRFTIESSLLPAGEAFSDLTIVVAAGGSAFVSYVQ